MNDFDPNGIGLKNGHFIGLPFAEDEANIVLISVPWDVTVSYGAGTAFGPENILEESTQLDLFDPEIKDAWKKGIYMRPSDQYWLAKREELRPLAEKYIEFLEEGGSVDDNESMQQILNLINEASDELNNWVYHDSKELLDQNKVVGVVGGEHSVPLGLIKALSERYADLGILHIDAHMDLRYRYEGFKYSHASIMNNALKESGISKLVQVGIRDCCDQEVELAKNDERVNVFFDYQIQENKFNGLSWGEQCAKIIESLPEYVYVSFDIDGLKPDLCPNTGTPVPGGLEFNEALYLLKLVAQSGRKIIGFDLCEVGGEGAWDGNVGARVLYKLCNWLAC